MKIISNLESAFAYANRLGLAGDPRTTCMIDKQLNLKFYADQMLKESGQASWPCIPFAVRFNRSTREFQAETLFPGIKKLLGVKVATLKKQVAQGKKKKSKGK